MVFIVPNFLVIHFGEKFTKIWTKIVKLQIHEKLHKNVNENFIHIFMQIFMSFMKSNLSNKYRTALYCYLIYFKWRYSSTLDKQRICVNTQLKSSKKQLKWNVCVAKSNSYDRYAITCDVVAYH